MWGEGGGVWGGGGGRGGGAEWFDRAMGQAGLGASGGAAGAVGVVAAGGGTVRLPAHEPGAPASAPTGRVATAAGNRAAASAEAARLLSLARVPPGAVRLARPPWSLPGPALGRPAVASLVDRVVAGRGGVAVCAGGGSAASRPPPA